MTLSQFIRTQIEPMLEDWIRFARSITSASRFDEAVLRDHAAGILMTIAADLEHPQSMRQQADKSHGLAPHPSAVSEAHRHGADRLLDGFTVNDALSEFRALRASVLKHWTGKRKLSRPAQIEELIRFNEAIDQAITESLEGFSADKERSEGLVTALMAASADLCFVLDLRGILLYGNAALASEFGLPLSEQQGKPFAQLDAQAARDFQRQIRSAAMSAQPVKAELILLRDGIPVVYEYVLVAVPDSRAGATAVAGNARDVTMRKGREERLRHGAHYDHLTGLPNRYLFRDRLDQEIKRSDRVDLPLALCYIDLDGFKAINDQFGHECGDELLRQCAQRIRACVRESDTVARLGGDEFTAIVSDITHLPHVDLIAEHILEELSRVFTINGHEITVSGSIGIALYPRDATSPEELIRNADNAMYVAKSDGRNNFRFFTDEMREAAALRMQTIGELRQALVSSQFAVFYQPIVKLADGTIIGAEAQLRWKHPRLGLLVASQFSPLAEEAGLAVEIDEWVLGDATARADTWNAQRTLPLYLSVNHSSLGATGKQAARHLQAVFEQLAKTRSQVALEINESVLSRHLPGTCDMLHLLSAAGVQIYLDDFGTGASSLTCLTTGGLTGLKIDGAIVREMDKAEPRAIAAGIIGMAHGLGLKVIAEGVETAAQRDVLRGMGCDYAQGFLFSRAVPASSFAELIRQ